MPRLLAALIACALLTCCSARNLSDYSHHGRGLKAAFAPTFWPENPGTWLSHYPTAGLYMIHMNLMHDGKVVGWSTVSAERGYGTAVCDPLNPRTWPLPGQKHLAGAGCQQILGRQGISGGKNHFCAGQVTTPNSEIILFGGHNGDAVEWLRHFDYKRMRVQSMKLSSGRWYPGVATLPDGKVLMVAGVAKSGCSNYMVPKPCNAANNPTYEIYDPVTRRLSGDRREMAAQLNEAFPMSTYPHVIVTPDGGVAVAAKKSLVKYNRLPNGFFARAFAWEDRPGPGWVYPQTGQGILLPMTWEDGYRMRFLAAGGSVMDNAAQRTPASDQAWMIELTDPKAKWQHVGRMPQPRVMGDSVITCDGKILFVNGAGEGIAGWGTPVTYRYSDGVTYACKSHCSMADRHGVFNHRSPIIFDPATGAFSAKDSLGRAVRPRLYHSSALLLPSCQVMVSGSDVTGDTTAEVFSPPHLFRGPRPVITAGPAAVFQGQDIAVAYTSAEPVTRALLIRTGATTHSMPFDLRALWLPLRPGSGPGRAVLGVPPNKNLLPPGMYMVVLHTAKGAVSQGHILSIYAR